jgi:hypothetical protein
MNIQISMTEKFHCHENSVAERVNGISKDEYGLDVCFKTKEERSRTEKEIFCRMIDSRMIKRFGGEAPRPSRAAF